MTTVQTERGVMYWVPPGAPLATFVEQMAPRNRPVEQTIPMVVKFTEDTPACTCDVWVPACRCDSESRRATAGGNSGPKPRGPK